MIATAVGNYPKIPNPPRPAQLRIAISRLDRRLIDREELARVEDEVTREVIGEQVEAGLDLVTDGMIRWDDAQTYLARAMKGFEIGGLIRYFDTNTYYRQPVVTGSVDWHEPITVRDFEFARRHAGRPVKPVLTGPLTLASLSQDEFYKDREALALVVARALRREIDALAGAGAPLVQVDEPWIARRRGDESLFRTVWKVLLENLDVPIHLYTYFGDVTSYWPVIRDLGVAVVGLDLVMGEAGWELLTDGALPFGLSAGIVDARNTRLEDEEDLVGKILRLATSVPSERLYISPSAGLEFLPRERAQEKLTLMTKAVRAAEERLT